MFSVGVLAVMSINESDLDESFSKESLMSVDKLSYLLSSDSWDYMPISEETLYSLGTNMACISFYKIKLSSSSFHIVWSALN